MKGISTQSRTVNLLPAVSCLEFVITHVFVAATVNVAVSYVKLSSAAG